MKSTLAWGFFLLIALNQVSQTEAIFGISNLKGKILALWRSMKTVLYIFNPPLQTGVNTTTAQQGGYPSQQGAYPNGGNPQNGPAPGTGMGMLFPLPGRSNLNRVANRGVNGGGGVAGVNGGGGVGVGGLSPQHTLQQVLLSGSPLHKAPSIGSTQSRRFGLSKGPRGQGPRPQGRLMSTIGSVLKRVVRSVSKS